MSAVVLVVVGVAGGSACWAAGVALGWHLRGRGARAVCAYTRDPEQFTRGLPAGVGGYHLGGRTRPAADRPSGSSSARRMGAGVGNRAAPASRPGARAAAGAGGNPTRPQPAVDPSSRRSLQPAGWVTPTRAQAVRQGGPAAAGMLARPAEPHRGAAQAGEGVRPALGSQGAGRTPPQPPPSRGQLPRAAAAGWAKSPGAYVHAMPAAYAPGDQGGAR